MAERSRASSFSLSLWMRKVVGSNPSDAEFDCRFSFLEVDLIEKSRPVQLKKGDLFDSTKQTGTTTMRTWKRQQCEETKQEVIRINLLREEIHHLNIVR